MNPFIGDSHTDETSPSSNSSEIVKRRKRQTKKRKQSRSPVRKRKFQRRAVIESSSSDSETERDEGPQNLTEKIPNILGALPSDKMASGPSFDSEIVNRWSSYLTQGFNKDTRELWAKIPFPGNCPLLEAPKLNPEIEAILSTTDSKKDSFFG